MYIYIYIYMYIPRMYKDRNGSGKKDDSLEHSQIYGPERCRTRNGTDEVRNDSLGWTGTDRNGLERTGMEPERTGTDQNGTCCMQGPNHVNTQATLNSWTGISHGRTNWNRSLMEPDRNRTCPSLGAVHRPATRGVDVPPVPLYINNVQ